MFKPVRVVAALFAVLVALTAAPSAFAQTYTVYRNVTAPGGVTGTMQIELADSSLAPNTALGGPPPPELVSFNLTLTGLGETPTTTTFTRANLTSFYFTRDGAGGISDINFQAATNTDGYNMEPMVLFGTDLFKGGYIVRVTNTAGTAPSVVPTLTEWAMILLGLILAGGAVAIIQRRRSLT